MADADSETEDSIDQSTASDEKDPEDVDQLVANIASYDEVLAEEVNELREHLAELEAELDEVRSRADDLESRLKRTHADFQNYKKRSEKRQEQIRERATEDLLERILDVRDNLLRALEQDDNTDIRDGVDATLTTFDRILEDEGVTPINPQPGDEPDPEYHEVVMRVSGEQARGTIEEVYRPGYELGGVVLRPAQVAVCEEED